MEAHEVIRTFTKIFAKAVGIFADEHLVRADEFIKTCSRLFGLKKITQEAN
jgi:hypothetical protein